MKIITLKDNSIFKKKFFFYFWVWDEKTKLNKLLIKLYNYKILFLYKNIYILPFHKNKFILITFSSYIQIINKFWSFNKKVLIISFYLKLSITGIGYKIFYLQKILILIINYSHIIKFKFLNQKEFNIRVDNLNNFIILNSSNKELLGNFSYIVKFFRMFNCYNYTGINNIYNYFKKNKKFKKLNK
nr:ribosomal protein L6 [Sarcocystis poephagicanis]